MKTQLFEAAWRWALKLFRNTLWIVKLTQHGRYFNKWLNTNSTISWKVLGSHFLSVFPSCSLLSGMPKGEKVLGSAPLKGDPNRVLTRMPSLTGTDSSSHWELAVCICVCEGWGLVSERAKYLCAFIMRRQTSPVKLNNSLIFSHACMQECTHINTREDEC